MRKTLRSLFITADIARFGLLRNVPKAKKRKLLLRIFFYQCTFDKSIIWFCHQLWPSLSSKSKYLIFKRAKDVFTIPAAGMRERKFLVHLHTRVIAIERHVRRAIPFNWECDVYPAVTGTTRATGRISAWAWTVDGPPGVFHCPPLVWVSTPPSNVLRTGVYL